MDLRHPSHIQGVGSGDQVCHAVQNTHTRIRGRGRCTGRSVCGLEGYGDEPSLPHGLSHWRS
eukprot:5512214-Prorocentrum_lima.AAC.1